MVSKSKRLGYGALAPDIEITDLASSRKTFMAGVLGAVLMSALMNGAAWLGLSPLRLEPLLGSVVTKQLGFPTSLLGFAWNMINGGVFALLYAATFRALRSSGASIGALLGVGHWVVAGLVGNALYAMHPIPVYGYRVVGFFFWMIFGGMTVFETLIAHVLFGAVVGLGFRRAGQSALLAYTERLARFQHSERAVDTDAKKSA